MNKLRNKVFNIIFIILTISVLSFIFLFNIQKYIELKNNVKNSLNMATNKNDKEEIIPDMKPDIKPNEDIEMNKDNNIENNIDKNIKFMDSTIYTVLINDDNSIKEVINHSNNNISDTKINSIAKNILDKDNIKELYIGNLYFNNYSYKYVSGDSLTILDNTKIRSSLILSLEISIIIFVVLELIIYFITKLLTKYITEPVNNTFKKQKEFIEDASHELKTPLSVIIASTEALENDYNEKWINNIKYESERMNNLIINMLELAKSEHEEKITKVNNNLSKIVELSILSMEVKAYEDNVKIKYDIEKDINMLLDEVSIKELLSILIDNAIKHSYKNSTININLKSNANNIVLLVKNKGDNISSEDRDKIFERFYRVDKSRNRNNNRYGLGLAIAKNIVLNHNGEISVESGNHITTFKVVFKK